MAGEEDLRDVTGVLTAMSLNIKNGSAERFIEIQNEHNNKVHIILRKKCSVPSKLEIGKIYFFTILKLWSSSPQGKLLDLWSLDAECVCTEVEPIQIPEITPGGNLIHYCGFVTDFQLSSSVYTLDNRIGMCVAFVDGVFKLPRLFPGNQITVYNAHKVTKNSAPFLILCGKSFIEINDKSQVNYFSNSPSETSIAVQRLGFGYRGYESVLKLSKFLRQKFPEQFLHFLDVNDTEQFYRELVTEVSTLMTCAGKCVEFEDIAAEFASVPHRCILVQEGEVHLNIASVQHILDCVKEHINSTDVMGGWGQLVFSHDVVGINLIGFLDVCPKAGRWTLSDCSADIHCVISNVNSVIPDVSAGRKLVLLKHYCIVMEKIESYSEEGKSFIANTYLHVMANCINFLEVSLNAVSAKTTDGTPEIKRRKISQISSSVSSGLRSTPSKHRKISVTGILLQKSAFLRKGNITLCALLVRFLGGISELAGATRSIILCATSAEHLRQATLLLPCCHLQLVYSPGLHLKKSKWSFLVKDMADYPIIWLPEEAQLVRCNVTVLPTLLQQQSVCSVKEVMKLPSQEIIDVQGQLIDRFHRYYKKRHSSKEEDSFGLPGGIQSVVLKLKDTSAEDAVILYLTEWNNHVYPFGAVVGSCILATSVKVIISQTRGTKYLCTTAFSRIEVLQFDPPSSKYSLNIPISVSQKQRSASVSLQSRTFSCPSLLYVRFSPHPMISEVAVKAWCMCEWEDRTILICLTNELVQQVLQIPPIIWRHLLSLAEKHNGLTYRRERSSFAKNKARRNVEKAVSLYIKAVDWKHFWNIEFWASESLNDKEIKAYATKLLKIC